MLMLLYFLSAIALFAANAWAQTEPDNAKASPFPWPEEKIAHYTAQRTAGVIQVDGRLNEDSWVAAQRSPRFVDLIYGEPTVHDTRAAVLWDDIYLYIGFWVEEPLINAQLTERDAYIYTENDVEVFIAGANAYYEFEINALGTFYEVFFIWKDAYEQAGYSALPEFDRHKPKVRPFHGVRFKHPRNPRIGFWNWDFPDLKTAVHVDGTLNNNTDRDRGWTVELSFPWKGMQHLADGRNLPPVEGDVWRIDFSRFNQYKQAPPSRDPGGWAWSAHGVWDSHVPECYPYIHFSTQPITIAPNSSE